MSSASVTIDSGVLTVPSLNAPSEDAHRYVESLFHWSKLLDEPWVDIYMSERASETLFDDRLYPLRDQLRQFFDAKGITEYAVNDIASIVNNLLQITPHLETYFKVRDVLAEQISTTPDILQSSPGSNLRSDFKRCVVLIAILREYCRNSILEHCLIIRYAPTQTVNVQALIYELEHSRNDLDALPTHPDRFDGKVLICDDFRGLIECFDESSILAESTDDNGLETAIRIGLYKSRLGRGEDPEWDDLRSLRIGRRFFDTVQDSCRNQGNSFPAKVLRAIVETLDGENLPATHPLRTGSGGGNPQRMRPADGASAMRRDIDNDHHLHYWSCGNGIVELASVSFPHDNFSIPE